MNEVTPKFGKPKDIDGACNAHLYLADDYGDNDCTIRCRLPEGHSGNHYDNFSKFSGAIVIIKWDVDERYSEV